MLNIKKPVRPTVLNIVGNDSAGMAGLAMDTRTQNVLGVHSASVITSNTAQNNDQVYAINAVDNDVLKSQLNAAFTLPIDVIKTGLIASPNQVSAIASGVEKYNLPLVCDPVLAASSGEFFSNEEFVETLKNDLIPLATIVTPNISEAEKLTGISIRSSQDIIDAAQAILNFGAKAVIVKGGHLAGNWSQDYFLNTDRSFWLSSKRIDSVNTRGTGCAFASSIASALALGYSIYDAVTIAKMAINQGIRLGYATETFRGPVNIQAFPDKQIDLPCLTATSNFNFNGIKLYLYSSKRTNKEFP